MKVEQFHAKNQFVITAEDGTRAFQSYDTVIAEIRPNGVVVLDEKYWNHSKTTAKYRNLFLGDQGTETAGKILHGVYKLADLNNRTLK